MIFGFIARVQVEMEHTKDDAGSRVLSTDFNIEVTNNLDRDEYLENDLPNAEGSFALTQTLCLGLIANIHMAHQMGYRDSAQHLRAIIQTLEDGFIENVEIDESKFK